MDYHRRSNGLLTFIEHWWLIMGVGCVILATVVLGFFTRLSGIDWIWCYAIALVFAGVGIALIFYSKLPLYRQHRFFTFGSGALPADRRSFYRWGYRCALFAIALLLCLFLSRP